MDDFKFNTIEELYKKLYPALNTKVNELKRKHIRYIKHEDIWNYLRRNYWNKSSKLMLSDMVNDILSTPDEVLEKYVSLEIQNRVSPKTDDELL